MRVMVRVMVRVRPLESEQQTGATRHQTLRVLFQPGVRVMRSVCFVQQKAHLKRQEMCLDAVPGILLQLLH